jgi:hypothetical protein
MSSSSSTHAPLQQWKPIPQAGLQVAPPLELEDEALDELDEPLGQHARQAAG